MLEKLKTIWNGKLFNVLGILVALATAVLADFNLPNTPHSAIWVPFAFALVTEIGVIFGKVDLAAISPRVVHIILAGATALSAYLTSNPAVSGWRYAPVALAILFSVQKAFGGGTAAAAPTIVVFAFLSFGSSGCAHIQPVVDNVAHDVEVCAGPACADAAKKAIPEITTIIMCDASAGFSPAALPACASAALADFATSAGPDGWRIIGCVVNAIEKDATKPPEMRARARAALPVAARMANGR